MRQASTGTCTYPRADAQPTAILARSPSEGLTGPQLPEALGAFLLLLAGRQAVFLALLNPRLLALIMLALESLTMRPPINKIAKVKVTVRRGPRLPPPLAPLLVLPLKPEQNPPPRSLVTFIPFASKN